MIANFDLDWVVYRGGLAGDKRWHRVQDNRTGEVTEYPVGKHKRDIEEELKNQGIDYTFLEKGRKSDPLPLVLHNCKVLIEKAMSHLRVDEFRFFISPRDGSNWRKAYAKEQPYKGNRTASDKPAHYDEIHEYLIKKYNPFICYGFEADDYVSFLQRDNTVLVDNDKDTLMIPGRHYNPVKNEKKIISPEEGELSFYKQLLMGDKADNIGGIKGIGAKTAEKLLKKFDNLEEGVYNRYKEEYGSKAFELMIERGNLLWMPRPEEEVYISHPTIWAMEGLTFEQVAKLLPDKPEIEYEL